MTNICVQDIVKAFGQDPILRGITLEVGSGEFVAVLGRSGSGKSTLLRIIAGLEFADDGTIDRNGNVAMVFQEARLIPWLRVNENLAIGKNRSELNAATAALDEVGLSEKARVWPATLSGGQAQRVSLARALVRAPNLLLLDEPFGALDALTRLEMQDLVHSVRSHHGFTSIMVTHDVEEAVRLADRVVILGDGQIILDEQIPKSPPRDPADYPQLVKRLLGVLGVRTHVAA